MKRVFDFVGNLVGSVLGIALFIFGILALPFNVIAIMHFWGWQWWAALIGSILLVAVPFVGQLGFLILAVCGAFFFVKADFNWSVATGEMPALVSFDKVSDQDFANYKERVVSPELERQCKTEFAQRYGINGQLTAPIARFCKCYVRHAMAEYTKEEAIYQQDHKGPSSAFQARVLAGASDCR